MEKYYITEDDVLDVLSLHELESKSVKLFPRSGQRQVFEVEFDSGEVSILKFVDVSPTTTYERYQFEGLSESEYDQEKSFEIEHKSKRILRELEASKKCSILPQIEISNEIQTFIKKDYHFLYYFETRFKGNTLDKSELYQANQHIDMIAQFLLQMVNQIKIMHEAGYVHRDITPRNIIYNGNEFKIIDAGLVKSNEVEKLTATELLIGTPYYMAPEQRKRTSDYTWDFRTDLFAIGLIAIELFLPDTRSMISFDIRDLHSVFSIWRQKDASSKSIALFTKVITRLAVEERSKRWMDLDGLIEVLESIIEEEV